MAGHLGHNKTYANVRQRFYWPGYREDIHRWCYRCKKCAQRKPGPGKGRAPLQQKPVGVPLERIAIDFLGPLPKTRNGNQHILVLADYFTKWTESYALPDQTAATVADAIVTQFVCRFGVPQQLHSDQGRDFESKLIAQLCERLQIEKTRTTPYRPQSDGLVERFNRTVQNMLAVFVDEHRDDWDDHLPYVMMAYRSTMQESTGCSPNLLMLGREINLPIDLMVGQPPREEAPECPHEYVQWVQDVMEGAFDFARGQLKQSAQRQKRNYDRKVKVRSYKPGEWVWYWYPPKARGKFGKGWTGPYLVMEKPTSIHYVIQESRGAPVRRVHGDYLKACRVDPEELPMSWLEPKSKSLGTQTENATTGVSSVDKNLETANVEMEDDTDTNTGIVEDLSTSTVESEDSLGASQQWKPEKVSKRSGRTIKPPLRLTL